MSGKPTTGPFEKTPGWLDWYTGPSKPEFKLPPNAVIIVVPAIVLFVLLSKRPIKDMGQVSRQWMSQHVGD